MTNFTQTITLPDSSLDQDFHPTTLVLTKENNRLEINLPDGQILALEQFLGETRLIHWTHPLDDDKEPTIVPLITNDESPSAS